jgi:magnesium chelatase subunit D
LRLPVSIIRQSKRRRQTISLSRHNYPFSAIVGQPMMQRALLLNAVNPKIGGLVLRGEKGTAKSIAVRALAALLPEIETVAGCRFACDPGSPADLCAECAARLAAGEKLGTLRRAAPLVELPLGATEDRVVGSIDIEGAIKTGQKTFQPGLLAAAHRGILYIDEVNLLDDHIVDVLLDAAAMGVNYVEREGISFSHPAEFILIGTMNPEEGELRPQLLDRFGLSVEIKGIKDAAARAEIVTRRIAWENDHVAFTAGWQTAQDAARQGILDARRRLPEVELPPSGLDLITRICLDFNVDGHRADIVMYRAARTIAADRGHRTVTTADISEAAELSLPHRRRRKPFEEPGLNQNQLKQTIRDWQQQQAKQPAARNPKRATDFAPQHDAPPDEDSSEGPHPREGAQNKEEVFTPPPPYQVKPIIAPTPDNLPRRASGRRTKSRSATKSGRYVASVIPRERPRDLAFDATLRAAAPHQTARRLDRPDGPALLIEKTDLRDKIREKKVGNLVVFLIDSSGSMAAEQRMRAAKGAVLSLLLDAYQRRDMAAMVVMRGEKAELALPPTDSFATAEKYLAQLATGGKTPLAHGLKLTLKVIRRHRRKDHTRLPLLVLISDGRANVALNGGDPVADARSVAEEIRAEGIHAVGIDTETGGLRLGLVSAITEALGGHYYRLENIQDSSLFALVQQELD